MQFPNVTNSLQPCNPKNEKNDFKANKPYTKANNAHRLSPSHRTNEAQQTKKITRDKLALGFYIKSNIFLSIHHSKFLNLPTEKASNYRLKMP